MSPAEFVVGPVGARDADDRECVGKQSSGGEVIERGQQQPLGQIAGGAENDEGARIGAARRAAGGGNESGRGDVHVQRPFGSTCPPNPLRIADNSRSAKP